MDNPFLWVLLLVVLGAAWAFALSGRLRARIADGEPKHRPAPMTAETDGLRSRAFEAFGDAILLVGSDGVVRDCNNAALNLFERPRAALLGVEAGQLRRLDDVGGVTTPSGFDRSPWQGDAFLRQNDGTWLPCLTNIVPLQIASDRPPAGWLESYRRVPSNRNTPPVAWMIRETPATGVGTVAEPSDPLAEIRADLLFLASAFRELDRVVRQYDRLLPAVAAEDPLAEAIAGLASETRDIVRAADVPALLDEVPRVLARVRQRIGQLGQENSIANG
jgi:hypothetical protein